jgi:hypothetical protein
MKVVVAGSRSFKDYNLLCQMCDEMLNVHTETEIEIVSGTAKGADTLGERYAAERGFLLTRFPAQWEMYGRSAGYKRNAEMAVYADSLIAFWDGESKGTKHMIDLAKQHKLQLKVVFYTQL